MDINFSQPVQFPPGDGPAGRSIQNDKPQSRPEAAADVVLRTDHADYIEQARNLTEQAAIQTAEQARAIDLQALDTPENIRKAAENILRFGI